MKTYFLPTLLFSLLASTACSVSETEENKEPQADIPGEAKAVMEIIPSISALAAQSVSRMTSPTDNTFVFETEDIIGIHITPEETAPTGIETNYNTPLTRTATGWKAESPLYWTSGTSGTRNQVIGYYPYIASLKSNETISLPIGKDQRKKTDLYNCDYLWGKTSATLTNKKVPVPLILNHVMSEVFFQVSLAPEMGSAIEELKIFSCSQANLNQATGTVTVSGERTALKPFLKDTPDEGFCQTYQAFIVPQQYKGEDFISFTLLGKTYTRPLSHTLESNKYYIFHISVEKEDQEPTLLLLSEGGIANWETGSDDNYNVEVLPGTYRAGDLWPDSQHPLGMVIRARTNNTPGLLMSLEKKYMPITAIGSPLPAIFTGTPARGKKFMETLEEYLPAHSLTWKEFPAFEYCHSFGNGWFIPTNEEALEFLKTALMEIGTSRWIAYMAPLDQPLQIWTCSFPDSRTGKGAACELTRKPDGYYYSLGSNTWALSSLLQVRTFKYY